MLDQWRAGQLAGVWGERSPPPPLLERGVPLEVDRRCDHNGSLSEKEQQKALIMPGDATANGRGEKELLQTHPSARAQHARRPTAPSEIGPPALSHSWVR